MDELQPSGPSWDERSEKGNLAAVLDPLGSKRKNLYIHSIHVQAIRRALSNLPKGHALDLGCGTGRMCQLLLDQGWQAVGMDITLGMLRKARGTHEARNASFINMDGLTLPVRDDTFDLVLTVYTLQHVMPSPHLFPGVAAEIFRVLKPTGTLLMLEITDTGQLSTDNYGKRLATAGFSLIHDEPVRSRYDRFMTLSEQSFVPEQFIPLLGMLGRWRYQWRYSRGERASNWWDHLYVFAKQSG
jgi:ubiquinone/menaquinone biosynthesis C-methylase UbiE